MVKIEREPHLATEPCGVLGGVCGVTILVGGTDGFANLGAMRSPEL